ncbi:MAG: cysteine desulfurase family protein [Bacteriovoracaceae bacterium]
MENMNTFMEENIRPIYADYNGSGPLSKEVRDYIKLRLEGDHFANPNAIHKMGQKVLMAMENARAVCARYLGAIPKQIVFNSGSTEGINSVFYSVCSQTNPQQKPIIITSDIEHSAIYNVASRYEKDGFETIIIKTLPNGQVDLENLKELLRKYEGKIALLTVMAANNETGVIQPISEIAELIKGQDIPFFSDTTQFLGKSDFKFKDSGLDFAVLSGHKIGAMTGAGALIIKDPSSFKPFILGGGQEKGHRGGTQNYLGYETIAVALEDCVKSRDAYSELSKSRDEFEKKIHNDFPETVIFGQDAPRLPGTTYISYPGVHGQAIQIELESQNIFVTTSSACSDNSPVTSRVLRSMGVDDSAGRGVVRISICAHSGKDCYERIYEALKKAYSKLTKIENF